MILLILFPLFSFAELSLPEFECTSIKTLSADAQEILGSKNYPSITLRKFSNSDWLLALNGKEIRLDREKVIKYENFILSSTQFKIQLSENKISIDLKGKPPSRQGILSISGDSILIPKDLAQLTCH